MCWGPQVDVSLGSGALASAVFGASGQTDGPVLRSTERNVEPVPPLLVTFSEQVCGSWGGEVDLSPMSCISCSPRVSCLPGPGLVAVAAAGAGP